MNEREIFMAALDREPPDERTRYLDQACGQDRELRRRVDALLQSYADSGSFLERPVLADEKTLRLNSTTNQASPPPRADDPPDLPDPNSDPISLDFLQPCDAPGRLGRIGPYEVIDVIGRGGMGVVLRAHDPKLNRTVAVKVIAPEFAVNPTARKRFLREARAAAAIAHPHVITIYAVEETEQTSYMVMECIDALSLAEKIERCGHLELKEILRIGAQIAAGLAAAHAHGLVHRDIKPSNILLEDHVERVKITDFGLARAVDDVSMTRAGEIAGTPEFMSPEQAQGKPVDPRSDLFSLGAVLYAMCAGRSPFRAEASVAVLRRVCDDAPRPIRQVNPDIPEELAAIIDRLLAKDPDERLQTAEEVSDLLLRYLAHLQDPATNPPPAVDPLGVRQGLSKEQQGARAARRSRRRTLMLAAAVLLGLCVSVAVTDATGVTHLTTTLVRIALGEGTLVVEVDDPQVSITIDGEDLVITGAGPQEVRLRPGRYRVQAAKSGQVVKQELVTIQRGGRQVVKVALEPSMTQFARAREGAVARPAPVPLPLNQWVDLLPRVDQRCFLMGRWERRGESLVRLPEAASNRGIIEFPAALEGSYDLQIDFTVISGILGSGLVLPVGRTHCQATFYSWNIPCDGIEWIDGRAVVEHVDGQWVIDKRNPTAREGLLFEAGEHSILIHVRVKGDAATIDVLRDGKPHLSWSGKQESLSLPIRSDHYPGLDTRRPGMSLYHGPTSLNRVRVRHVAEGLTERLEDLSKSIQSNPQDAHLLEQRGRVSADLGRYDDAARDFIRASELSVPPGWAATSALFDALIEHEEVFARIDELRPDDLALWATRARYYALRSQWEQALSDFARVSDAYPVSHAWTLLLAGKEDGYRDLCQRMAANFGQTDDPQTARRLVWICSSGAQSGIDPARISQWAELSLGLGRDKYTLFPFALACYRAGQFDRTVTILQEAMELPEPEPRSEAAFLLALAYRGLGQEEESRKWYRIGVADWESAQPPTPDAPVAWGVEHWMIVNVCYREAKAVFEPPDQSVRTVKDQGANDTAGVSH
jgi:serine/threonine protein kinase/tetratricopeptide (TPR) repeat protein